MTRARRTSSPRLGVILPVVLVMIGLLALTMAGFVFFVRAEMSGIRAENDGQQARLAAESGFEEIVAILRELRHDPTAWFDKPDRLRHVLVYVEGFDRESDPVAQVRSRGEYLANGGQPPIAWRWTAVASRTDGPEGAIRFGITPEAGKLNLNTAGERQIRDLFTPLLAELGVENHAEIIDAVLDWRDGDSNARGAGAENEYYNTLIPPYNTKNGRFDTIEELLLVKGVTAAMLYGEDVNRNGLLDPNEDDGAASEPTYDNGDGVLNRGLAEFLTVSARDIDTALDNKPRINLNTGPAVAAQIAKVFTNNELSEATIAFLAGLQAQGINPAMLRSPADLLPPGPDETPETLFANPEKEVSTSQPAEGEPEQPTTGGSRGSTLLDRSGGQKQDTSGEDGTAEKKDGGRNKAQDKGGKEVPPGSQDPTEEEKLGLDPASNGGEEGGKGPTGGQLPQQPERGGRGGQGGRGGGTRQITPEQMFNALKNSPVTLQELPYLMDRFSTRPVQQATQPIEGLIDINTAPARVLALIPGITPDAVQAIIAGRSSQAYEAIKTTAWPLTIGAVDAMTFKRIAPYVTTKSYQFHVEVIGYADHAKIMRRLEWIIEMVGPMAQVKYHRDLTGLGMGFPIDSEQVVAENGAGK
ncbi:MAG: general secretion pathway protein GspK [Planctomycetes bacterium]|nr:general secretion pathway protein GspK [Planctomycetota bacterium]